MARQPQKGDTVTLNDDGRQRPCLVEYADDEKVVVRVILPTFQLSELRRERPVNAVRVITEEQCRKLLR